MKGKDLRFFSSMGTRRGHIFIGTLLKSFAKNSVLSLPINPDSACRRHLAVTALRANIESMLPNLHDLPAQLLWGTKDSAGFPLEQMAKWQRNLPLNETEILEDASHYVQEDAQTG
jgi:pimeloyl-ACP methyl ester carboxylesterase